MTAKELYRFCAEELLFTECGDFEAGCIFEDLLNISKTRLLANDISVTNEQVEIVKSVIQQRKNGRPLQYIVGKWDFYDMTFNVGEGVLIPRPETEMLVDIALDYLSNKKNAVIYDVCAGTGCIGLTVARHCKNSTVFLFEKEDMAYEYLEKNIEKYSLTNVKPIKCDIFDYDLKELPSADVLLSNPPYINTDRIPTLQKEVLNEPLSALDGGKDGLKFYRCIYEKWVNKVKKGGLMAFECGENQGKSVCSMFEPKTSTQNIIFDLNNIDRTVTFRI